MLTLLRLEIIGEARPDMQRVWKRLHRNDRTRHGLKRALFPEPWVVRLNGRQRVFIRPQRDYSQADESGLRGVFCVYWLDDGVYEVSGRVSATQERRYFVRVSSGSYARIAPEEVDQWLSAD